MGLAATYSGDVQIAGTLTPAAINMPNGSVKAAAISGGPGQYLSAAYQGQQYQKEYKQVSTANAATDQQVIHVVRGATAVIQDFAVGAIQACTGTGNAVFDLLKNGASILTGTITLGSGTAAYALLSGTLASTSLVAGDVLGGQDRERDRRQRRAGQGLVRPALCAGGSGLMPYDGGYLVDGETFARIADAVKRAEGYPQNMRRLPRAADQGRRRGTRCGSPVRRRTGAGTIRPW